MTAYRDDLSRRLPHRATVWRLRTRSLELPARPRLMGVINVTPDSFSNAGKHFDPQVALAHALTLAHQGADILDIGGESTRPYADPVSSDEELRRIASVVRMVCQETDVPVSIDTTKACVAAEAIASGAEIINDISGLIADPEMIDIARKTGAGVCAMHMRGTPQNMQDNPVYKHVVAEVHDFLRRRAISLVTSGLDPKRVAIDPGIGFGKTNSHNLTLLTHCYRFHSLGYPLIVGPSRKRFIGKVIGKKRADRTAGTVGVALSLARQGVQILRVHDVQPLRDALLLYEATGGLASPTPESA